MGSYSILDSSNPIIFFDTSCLLCNKTVQVLLKVDKKQVFIFAGLSSDMGVQVLSKNDIREDSVILFYRGKWSVKSNAILAICKLLGFPYILIVIFYLVPRFIRDWMYNLIARNRKKWFGTTERCLISSKNYSDRIIL